MEGDSITQLLCQENETFLEDEDEDEDEHSFIDFDLVKEEEEGYLEMLIKKEISFNFNNMGFDQNWIKCARLEAISWIFKSRETFGFRLSTIYLSIAYFDRFLSQKTIDSEKLWAVRLLSVACLSLAAKMEEIKVPPLTQFQLIEDYNFETKVIQRMELLVLNTLEWRMISTTPFPFLHYFFIKFCNNTSIPDQILVSRTVGFILALIKEINLMGCRPSVIAAAATLMALDQSLTRNSLEGRVNSISSSGLIQTEDVFQCYNIIKKLEMDDLETCSSSGTKRKRSAFMNSNQDYGLPEEKLQR